VQHVRTATWRAEFDASLSLLVERNTAESFVAESVVSGVEVHADPDVTWVVHPGNVWRNAAVMIRISDSNAASRLDTLIARYRRHGRGMGFWLSPDARPTDTRTATSTTLSMPEAFPGDGANAVTAGRTA
jgi:hypothetical protein